MSEDIIRQLEALQDEQEAEIIHRTSGVDDPDESNDPMEQARLLGIAIGLADGYRKAADLLRGGPRPGGLTFRAAGPIHRGG
jgi:hypothetical protein